MVEAACIPAAREVPNIHRPLPPELEMEPTPQLKNFINAGIATSDMIMHRQAHDHVAQPVAEQQERDRVDAGRDRLVGDQGEHPAGDLAQPARGEPGEPAGGGQLELPGQDDHRPLTEDHQDDLGDGDEQRPAVCSRISSSVAVYGLSGGHVRDRGTELIDRVEAVAEDGLLQDPVGVGVPGAQHELGAGDPHRPPHRGREQSFARRSVGVRLCG